MSYVASRQDTRIIIFWRCYNVLLSTEFCVTLPSLNVEEVVMVHTLQTLLLVVTPYMLYTAHRCGQAATIGQQQTGHGKTHSAAKVRIFSSQ